VLLNRSRFISEFATFYNNGTAFSRVLKTPAEIHNDKQDSLQQLGSIQLLGEHASAALYEEKHAAAKQL
jgi:hypothetical protein